MGMKKQIKLGFQMDGRDIRLVNGLLGKILNLGQISLPVNDSNPGNLHEGQ